MAKVSKNPAPKTTKAPRLPSAQPKKASVKRMSGTPEWRAMTDKSAPDLAAWANMPDHKRRAIERQFYGWEIPNTKNLMRIDPKKRNRA